MKELPESVNGHKIIAYVGYKGKSRYVLAECRICATHWEVGIINLKRTKSCGCEKSKLKPIGTHLNGFKVLKDLGSKNEFRKRRFIVECKECGNDWESYRVVIKKAISCGCLNSHGNKAGCLELYPDLMLRFYDMVKRCTDKEKYKYHGAKGIRVCGSWIREPRKFCEWAINNGYRKELTIDRIDNNKGYSEVNCRWVTMSVQARNTSRNVLNSHTASKMREDAKSMSLEDIYVKYKVSRGTVYNVINNLSWVD